MRVLKSFSLKPSQIEENPKHILCDTLYPEQACPSEVLLFSAANDSMRAWAIWNDILFACSL